MSSPSRKVEIVIIGGTSGGLAARALSSLKRFNPETHNLTFISQLPYAVFLPSTARMNVTSEGGLDESSVSSKTGGLLSFDKLFAQSTGRKFLHAKVNAVHDTRVELEDGTSVQFDYLVVATGSKWGGPMNFDCRTDEEVRAHLAEWRKKFSVAKHVVIVGGGPLGIELAGEIRHYHPTTALTMIHALPSLVNPTYPDKLRNALTTKVESSGVRVILNDRVLDLPAQGLAALGEQHLLQLKTENGIILEADLVIPAFGPTPNTTLLRTLRDGAALTSEGRVRITSTFNVVFPNNEVSRNIFAIGDIIEWDEQHSLAKGAAHAPIVAENIMRAIEGKKPEEGKPYKGVPEMLTLTYGPNGGAMYLPFLWGIMFGDWVVGMLKGKTLFVPMFRGMFGL